MRRSYDAFDLIFEVIIGVMLAYVLYTLGMNIAEAVLLLIDYGAL